MGSTWTVVAFAVVLAVACIGDAIVGGASLFDVFFIIGLLGVLIAATVWESRQRRVAGGRAHWLIWVWWLAMIVGGIGGFVDDSGVWRLIIAVGAVAMIGGVLLSPRPAVRRPARERG